MNKNQRKKYPLDWQWTRLGDLSKIVTGKTPPTSNQENYSDEGHLWVTPTDIDSEKYINESERKLSEEGIEKTTLLPQGSLLITCIASIGKNAILLKNGSCNQQINGIFPSDYHSNEFYYYFLSFNKELLMKYATTTATAMINKTTFENIIVPYPPYEEQQKIASILSTWDEAIEKYQNLLELIKLEKEGIAHRAIVHNAPQIDGYRKYKMGEILAYEQPQKYLENDISEEKVKDSVPVLTANKAFVLGYSKNLEGTYHEYPAIIFDDFTTDIKYVDFEFKVRSSAIKILTSKSDDINLKYVYETMNLIRFPLGGHKRHYISEYQYIKVGLPPKEYQDKIADLLTNMDEKIELIDSMIENLKEQKRGLMQLLLTGKVRV